MIFAVRDGLAYELVSCSDTAMLAIDEEIEML